MYPNILEIPPDAFVWWVRVIIWMARNWWILAALILGGAWTVSNRLARG